MRLEWLLAGILRDMFPQDFCHLLLDADGRILLCLLLLLFFATFAFFVSFVSFSSAAVASALTACCISAGAGAASLWRASAFCEKNTPDNRQANSPAAIFFLRLTCVFFFLVL